MIVAFQNIMLRTFSSTGCKQLNARFPLNVAQYGRDIALSKSIRDTVWEKSVPHVKLKD